MLIHCVEDIVVSVGVDILLIYCRYRGICSRGIYSCTSAGPDEGPEVGAVKEPGASDHWADVDSGWVWRQDDEEGHGGKKDANIAAQLGLL